MGVILGFASLMSYILVTNAKERSKKEIDSVISMYFTLKTSKDRKIVIGNVEKPERRIYAWNRLEKAGATVN
jgi:hypothetical protein